MKSTSHFMLLRSHSPQCSMSFLWNVFPCTPKAVEHFTFYVCILVVKGLKMCTLMIYTEAGVELKGEQQETKLVIASLWHVLAFSSQFSRQLLWDSRYIDRKQLALRNFILRHIFHPPGPNQKNKKHQLIHMR